MIEAAAGETVIDCRRAVTVKLADPTTVPDVACIEVFPEKRPLATPAALMVETLVFVDFHVTNAEILELTPLLKRPVAVNCCCVPALIDATAGVTEIAVRPVNVPVPLSEAV